MLMASLVGNKPKTLQEKISLPDKVSDKVNKKYGKKVLGRLGTDDAIMETLSIDFIPTPSQELNAAVGGGFPRRRCTLITSNGDSGKTSLVLETIAMNMRKNPEFVACWIESEHSLEKSYVCDTFGIDTNRFFYIPFDKEVGAEKTLDIVQGILELGAVDLLCINSLTCLIPDKEMDTSLSESTVAVAARLNSRMSKKFTRIIADSNSAIILILHLSSDIGSMSRDPLIMSGGRAIKYWSSLTLDLRKRAILAGDLIAKDEGVKICATVKKNHCIPWRNPYVKIEYYAIYGEGIEQILSCIDMAIAQGLLESKGSWLYWKDPESGEVINKWNSRANFSSYMRDNKDVWDKFQAMLSYDDIVTNLSSDEIDEIKAEEKTLDEIIENNDNE